MKLVTIDAAIAQAAEYERAGQWPAAEQIYRQIVAADPRNAAAFARLGIVLHHLNNLVGAEACFRNVVELEPHSVQARANLGRVLYDLERWDECEAVFRDAARLDPRNARALFNLGSAQQARGALESAADTYRHALTLAPGDPQVHNNLGIVLRSLGRSREAENHYRRALEIEPGFLAALSNLGVVLADQGRHGEAVEAFRRAIALEPRFAEAYLNLATSLEALGQVDEAVDAAARSLQCNPQLSGAYCNLGMCLQARGQLDAAIDAYRTGLRVDPADSGMHSNLVYALNYHPGYTREAIFAEHRLWGQTHADRLTAAAAPHANDRTPDRRLRIGYVSGHFRSHAVAVFTQPILESHDHQAFEIFCYSNGGPADDTTRRFQAAADHWRDVAALDDVALCDQVHADRIDILVDLAGHIVGNRLLAFARKPAPVQVTYIGYQNTTGMAAMNYRLTDAHADPPGTTDAFYAERLVRLPRAFYCYRPEPLAPEVGPLVAIERGYITFGSFNHFSKVTPQVLATWAEILRRVPDSRLVLLAHATPWMRAYVGQVFGRFGVADRVELTARRPYLDYLRLISEVDIALDSFPFNGHTTTCDCLWQGVPVVALAGDSYVSRFGSSAHVNLDLNSLVATSTAQYVELATLLAGNPLRLAELRGSLRGRMQASPLLDDRGFTRHLEAAYRQMWAAWCERETEGQAQA